MKYSVLILTMITILLSNQVFANIITVSAGGTIQAAIDASSSGDTIQVAAGTYTESLVVDQKSITLLGGYSADFSQRGIVVFETILISSSNTQPVILVESCTQVVIDGFTIKDGERGIEIESLLWPIVADSITISNNIIEDNGVSTEDYFHGGGILAIGSDIFIRNNIIRNNDAKRGGGITINSVNNFIIENNIIEDNIGHGDHGGGIAMDGSGTVVNNIIRNNSVGESVGYGWGGGALAYNYNSDIIYFESNVWTGNYAESLGGAMIIDEGLEAHLTNDLFYNNDSGSNNGKNLLIDDATGPGTESTAIIDNCTFYGSSSITIDDSFVTMKNSIVWDPNPNNNTDNESSNDNFYVYGGSTLDVSYSCFQLDTYLNTGIGNSDQYPQFADTLNHDFHLQSTVGRWEENTSSWVMDAIDSPLIDMGDPNDVYNTEPVPNGDKINMGYYGNTGYASKSTTTLGIELVKFEINALQNNDAVQLSWITVSEVNNDGFEVQKSSSIDLGKWSKIGWVKGHGNSNQLEKYYFTDNAPHHGLNYYRLKQIDNDLSFSYSSIKSIEYKEKLASLEVYPNPAQNIISFQNQEYNKYKIINIQGQILQIGEVPISRTIDVFTLPKGLYFLELTNRITQIKTKFIKE